jgi:chorismate dehydratase
VLFEKKYGVKTTFERMHAGVNDYSGYDAVLLIGDQSLQRNKFGLPGYELVFDLAKEWYDWQKMPFVFAVWAVKKSLPAETRDALSEIIENSLLQSEPRYADIGELRGKEIGLSRIEVEEYLAGFNYRLGEREREAMREFRRLEEQIKMANMRSL